MLIKVGFYFAIYEAKSNIKVFIINVNIRNIKKRYIKTINLCKIILLIIIINR